MTPEGDEEPAGYGAPLGQIGGSVPSGTAGLVHAAGVSASCAACRIARNEPNGDRLSSRKSSTSLSEGSGQESPFCKRPRFQSHRAVAASETRTSQLPPSLT